MIGPDPAEPRVLQGEGVHTTHALWDGGTSERGGHGATPGLAPGEAGGEDAPSLSLPRQVWSAGDLGRRTPPAWPQSGSFQGETCLGPLLLLLVQSRGGGGRGAPTCQGTSLPRGCPVPKGLPAKAAPPRPVFPLQEGVRPEGRFRGTRSPFVSEAGLQAKRSGGPGVRPRQARTCSPHVVEQGQAREEVLGPPGRGCGPGGREGGAGEAPGFPPMLPSRASFSLPFQGRGCRPGGQSAEESSPLQQPGFLLGPHTRGPMAGRLSPGSHGAVRGRVWEACDEGDTAMTGSKSPVLGSPRFPGAVSGPKVEIAEAVNPKGHFQLREPLSPSFICGKQICL